MYELTGYEILGDDDLIAEYVTSDELAQSQLGLAVKRTNNYLICITIHLDDAGFHDVTADSVGDLIGLRVAIDSNVVRLIGQKPCLTSFAFIGIKGMACLSPCLYQIFVTVV